jgi:hypothetical protein
MRDKTCEPFRTESHLDVYVNQVLRNPSSFRHQPIDPKCQPRKITA